MTDRDDARGIDLEAACLRSRSMAAATSSNVVGQPPPLPTRRYSMFHAAQPRSGQIFRAERARPPSAIPRRAPEAAVDDDHHAGLSFSVRQVQLGVLDWDPSRTCGLSPRAGQGSDDQCPPTVLFVASSTRDERTGLAVRRYSSKEQTAGSVRKRGSPGPNSR